MVSKVLTNTYFWLVIIAFILFLHIFSFSSPHYLILGGEGNYFLNLSETKSLYRYSWIEISNGTGTINPLLHFPFPIFDILALFQKLNLKFSNLLSVLFVYYLPFVSIFVLLKKCLKLNLAGSVIISLFYILNPFSSYYLSQVMFFNASALFILPVFFILINRNFYNAKKLFIFFGITSLLLSFGFSNLPLLGIALLSIPIFLIINSFVINNRLDLRRVLVNLILLGISFLMFNFWWIQNYLFNLNDFLALYTKDFAIGWITTYYQPQYIFYKLFSLKWLIPDSPGYNFFADFYYSRLVSSSLFLPFVLMAFYFLRLKRKRGALSVFFVFLLLILFLTAGAGGPLGGIYIFLAKNIPGFMIFKTPPEKFGVLLICSIAITIGFLLTLLSNKQKKYFYVLFIFYLGICSVPFFSGNFIPESRIGEDWYQSRKFLYKKEYEDAVETINKEKDIFRVMSLPGSLNYQVAMLNHENRYYTGMDPIMYALNKPFIAAYQTKSRLLFTSISDPGWEKILSLYNVRKIFVNKDIYPWFGFLEKESIEDIEKILDSRFKYFKNGSVLLYDNEYFLPHIYASPDKTGL